MEQGKVVTERRIQTKTSRTAEMKCLERAISYYEKDGPLKSNDYIAPMILPSFFRGLGKLGLLGTAYRLFRLSGIYEYVVVRTKYIDNAFKDNLNKVEQVLVFGAGFDSRAVRFQNDTKHAKFFELDSPVTQGAKVQRFKEKKIEVPSNVVFIPIDFDKDPLPQKLDEYGFKKDKVCLFLLEGVTMYLDPASVDATFKLISEYSAAGSIVIFDYIYASVVRQENLYEGEKKVYDAVLKAGEKWTFGIEKGEVNAFLSKYSLTPVNEATASDLEKMYLTGRNGKLAGRVTGTHALVTAKK
jgi:methyltransferase (TIGR00027 family)